MCSRLEGLSICISICVYNEIGMLVQVSDEAAGASSAAAAYMSDSSDGQSEKCPICLRSFTTQEIGTPEACDHSFCVDCLQEWSKVSGH